MNGYLAFVLMHNWSLPAAIFVWFKELQPGEQVSLSLLCTQLSISAPG